MEKPLLSETIAANILRRFRSDLTAHAHDLLKSDIAEAIEKVRQGRNEPNV